MTCLLQYRHARQRVDSRRQRFGQRPQKNVVHVENSRSDRRRPVGSTFVQLLPSPPFRFVLRYLVYAICSHSMRLVCAVPLMLASLTSFLALSQETPKSADPKIETIVFIRHGETSLLGLGQITCKGLNRALALPGVLISKFGRPDEIYAPDPTGKSHDLGGTFDYVRPLATIEPTAIRLGMPVNCDYRFDHIKELENELLGSQHAGKLIFIAWEHQYLNQMVKDLLQLKGGDPKQVPALPWYEYDRVYILRIPPGSDPITFAQDQENLNNLSDDCPESRNQ